MNNDEDCNDSEWTPPTEAERKVIEARRERSNKISSLMGQYLLKGYKMLATTCSHCECILLEDKQKRKYCIACSEVDADTKKDNPAVNEFAARRTVAENQHRQTREESSETETATPKNSSETVLVLPRVLPPHSYQRQVSSDSLKDEVSPQSVPEEVTQALITLKQKLSWASLQLQTTTDSKESLNLVKLVSETVSALYSVQEFVQSWR